MDPDSIGGLEKETLEDALLQENILGKRPKKGPIKKIYYDISSWAAKKYKVGIKNRFSRFFIGYLVALYGEPLIPRHQREITRYLNMGDDSYLSKHGTTTVAGTMGVVDHAGLFAATHQIEFMYGVDDVLFWANLAVGKLSNVWRMYMAFKDELESPEPFALARGFKSSMNALADAMQPNSNLSYGGPLESLSMGLRMTAESVVSESRAPLRSRFFIGLRKKGKNLGEYLETSAIGRYKRTKFIPTFLNYTFQKGSQPTPSISWRFLTNQSAHSLAKGGHKLLKRKKAA